MFGRSGKKLSPLQQFVQEKRALLDHVDAVIDAKPAPHEAADYYLSLRQAHDRVEKIREHTVVQALRGSDSKRFWTAFGVNTPLVATFVLMEPVTGTLALLSTILTGYAPVVPIKHMLDKSKMGDSKALRSIALDVETLDIAADRLMKRCDEVEATHVKNLHRTPASHTLFRMYPSLIKKFDEAARKADQARPQPKISSPAPSQRQRRFGY